MDGFTKGMSVDEYLEKLRPLSIPARLAVGLRLFGRYVRVRGLEDDTIWSFLADMWEFPLLATLEDRNEWSENRGELADFGLGDELPDELEEELVTLAISEDFFELWVTNLSELAWTNLLEGPQDEESLGFLRILLLLSVKVEIPVVNESELTAFQSFLFAENGGWGRVPMKEDLSTWQSASAELRLVVGEEELEGVISEISQECQDFFE